MPRKHRSVELGHGVQLAFESVVLGDDASTQAPPTSRFGRIRGEAVHRSAERGGVACGNGDPAFRRVGYSWQGSSLNAHDRPSGCHRLHCREAERLR